VEPGWAGAGRHPSTSTAGGQRWHEGVVGVVGAVGGGAVRTLARAGQRRFVRV
jgi:hypothetical protein